MTYSLNTLNSSRHSQPSVHSGWRRFTDELKLVGGLLALAMCLLSLASYSLQDMAWSTSGTGGPVLNRAGRLGAWLADGSYFLLGFSVWWCVAAGVRAWLSALARWLRGRDDPMVRDLMPISVAARLAGQAWVFWVGLLLLLGASTTLEWTRFYSLESHLPGHGGGILGYFLGPLSVHWLGFTGSGLVAIAIGVLGSALVFRFSWSQVAERLGGWLYGRLETRREKIEFEQDVALGQQAAKARADVLVEERQDIAVHHPKPVVVIEPVAADVPKSERVAKERQKALFKDMLDSKLPQVDLLDAALSRQETVAPETLEMTSRMIEKKLKDFGVDVSVVLAQPGPVITRYEIEPATGVKGSQIVGLAKDLARSLSLVSIRVVETIPGKNFMALELPNAKRQTINLSEILGSQIYN